MYADVYSRPTSRCCERRSRGAPGTRSMPPGRMSCRPSVGSRQRGQLCSSRRLCSGSQLLCNRAQRRHGSGGRQSAPTSKRAPSPRELEAVPSQRSRSPSTVGHSCAAVPSRTRSVRREAGEVMGGGGGGWASLQRAPSCSRGQHHAALKHQNSNSGFSFRSQPRREVSTFLNSNFQLLNTCASLTERSRSPSICGDRELT